MSGHDYAVVKQNAFKKSVKAWSSQPKEIGVSLVWIAKMEWSPHFRGKYISNHGYDRNILLHRLGPFVHSARGRS
jgi:hypothetical protein